MEVRLHYLEPVSMLVVYVCEYRTPHVAILSGENCSEHVGMFLCSSRFLFSNPIVNFSLITSLLVTQYSYVWDTALVLYLKLRLILLRTRTCHMRRQKCTMQYFTSALSGFWICAMKSLIYDQKRCSILFYFIFHNLFQWHFQNGIYSFFSLVVSSARNANWHLSLGDTQLACSPIIATASSYAAAVQISLCYEAINKLRLEFYKAK